MKHSALAICLTVLLYCLPASATPITFFHEGYGSGTLDGTSFEAPFTITATGNTGSIRTFPDVALWIDHLTASIDIVDIGVFGILVPTRTFVNNSLALVGFGVTSPYLLGGHDLFNGPTDVALSTWDMLSSIGPITGNGTLKQWTRIDINTTGGVLTFDDGGTQSQFAATVSEPVSAPVTLALFGIGLAGLGWSRRKKD